MSEGRAPLYQVKADLFRCLGHPVRIRALELLAERDHAVHQLLAEIQVEQSGLSQHLAVLRRSGLVRQQRIGGEVIYALVSPEVRDLLASARRLITEILGDRQEMIEAIEAEGGRAKSSEAEGRRAKSSEAEGRRAKLSEAEGGRPKLSEAEGGRR